jgi:hypothetical protein
MTEKLIRSDFRVDVGRADRGRTFVRVVHLPTGKDRILVGLDGADPGEVALRLTNELASEIDAQRFDRNPPSDLQRSNP